jgi:diguanylate cyclase (GGDEF)-like protein/PAS domain S-box-containing protein
MLGAGVLAPAVGAVVVGAGIHLLGRGSFQSAWLTYFLSISVGVMMLAPLAVAAVAHARRPRDPRQLAELVALTLLSALLALVFVITDIPVMWVGLIVPVAAALRHGALGASLAFMPVSLTCVIATAHGYGGFAAAVGTGDDAIALAQVYIAVAGTLASVLGAAASQLELVRVGLRRSEDRFRALVEGVRDHAMFTLDGVGRIDSWNASARDMFGYEDAEVIGKALTDLAAGAESRDLEAGLERASATGHFEGEAGVHRADGVVFLGRFTVSTMEREGLAVVVRDVTDSRRTERRLRHMALHDALTRLPNRALLTDRLSVALATVERDGGEVAVLFCDLDRFKVINDSLGHEVGDAVLMAVAGRFRDVLRPDDTVARFGGDEFVVCCRDVAGAAHATRLAERIRAHLKQPIEIAGEQLYVGASIGIAIGSSGARPEDLLRDADVAMYRAKQSRTGYALAEAADRTRAMGRLRGETAVRSALARGELALHYQPIMDLQADRIVAFEALLRWKHPVEGLLLPGDFIRVAEETGAIVDIGAWVIEEACAAGRRFRSAAPEYERLTMNVNVSARQLTGDALVATVGSALIDTATDPHLLCLELTETTLIDDLPMHARLLDRLERLGVRLAIDDFGAGYSSLRYLSRLPIHTVKLDRSFVADMSAPDGGGPILRAAVSMAKAFDLAAVAEGVERAEDAQELLRMGYPLAQGFHFARPMPEADAVALLASGSASTPAVTAR